MDYGSCTRILKRFYFLLVMAVMASVYMYWMDYINVFNIWNPSIVNPLMEQSQTIVTEGQRTDTMTINQLAGPPDISLSIVDFKHIEVTDASQCAGRKFLVYTCHNFCGGWGDRQNGIVSSFLLALLSNRTFVIDMTIPCQLDEIMDVNLYNWKICKDFVKNQPKQDIVEVYRIDKRALQTEILNPNFVTQSDIITVRLNTNVLILQTIRKHTNASNVMKWIMHLTNPEVVHEVLKILFKNTENVQRRVDTFMVSILKRRTLVCAHVRIGKNPSLPSDGKLFPTNETTILSFLHQYADTDKYLVYIASDSDSFKHHAVKIMPDNVVITNETIVHVDQAVKRHANKSCEGFNMVLYEQELLSRCDIFLMTSSNFGFNAAYRRGTSEGRFLYIRHTNKINSTNLDSIWKRTVTKNRLNV